MQIPKTLSLNIKVVEEFEREVDSGDRSRIIEAMMIRFLMEYSKEDVTPPRSRGQTPIAKKEIK